MRETFVDLLAEKYLIRLQNALERKIWGVAGFGDLRSASANSVSRISGSSNRFRVRFSGEPPTYGPSASFKKNPVQIRANTQKFWVHEAFNDTTQRFAPEWGDPTSLVLA